MRIVSNWKHRYFHLITFIMPHTISKRIYEGRFRSILGSFFRASSNGHARALLRISSEISGLSSARLAWDGSLPRNMSRINRQSEINFKRRLSPSQNWDGGIPSILSFASRARRQTSPRDSLQLRLIPRISRRQLNLKLSPGPEPDNIRSMIGKIPQSLKI